MFSFLKNLFTAEPEQEYKLLVKNGAQVVDVRSPEEFRSGHIKNAINIPLQKLDESIGKLKKDKPVIVYCASGNRSASAKRLLDFNGFSQVVNGGGFRSLQNKLA